MEAKKRILKNCWKALPAKNGKVVLVEFLRDRHDNNIRGKYVECMDLLMLTYLKGTKLFWELLDSHVVM